MGKKLKFFICLEKGLTGYPIVDAGMHENFIQMVMHNRVRMIVGSFLVKHLLRLERGEKYFRNCLLDYSPQVMFLDGNGLQDVEMQLSYFRIFNPILQGEKFDKDGAYVKKMVPNKEPT